MARTVPTRCFAAAALALLAPTTASAANYYVAPAPTGSDAAAGTQAAPFASWGHAQDVAAPGDTVYFRGGTYRYTDATATCPSATATVSAIILSKSGTQASPIRYSAYPGEKPVFDFSGISDTSKYSCRQVGVRVAADWLYLKGLELKGTLQLNNNNHESWCVYVDGGNNNTFEQLDMHHNMGPGFFIVHGGHNLALNCDSHENEDTLTSNGDGQSADGFGCHPNKAGDSGNVFRGCRGWWNSDDNWDFIDSQEACTVENSWAWYAGYKPDALSNGQPVSLAAGNGNGFKGGGYGDPQTHVPAVPPLHTIRQNAAFYNKANGLYANHEIINPYFYNNTSFNNGTDVNMLGLNGATVTSVGTLRNNIAFSNDGHSLLSQMTNGGPIDDKYNSWDTSLNLTLSASDFQTVAFAPPSSCPSAFVPGGVACVGPNDKTSFAGMASARQADGSLPVLPFLRLASTSPLIDKGVNVGLPYAGAAPDLGCFETGLAVQASDAGTGQDAGSSEVGPPDLPDAFPEGDASSAEDSTGPASEADATGNETPDGASGSSGGSAASGTNTSGGSSPSGGSGVGGSEAGNGAAGGSQQTPQQNGGCSCRAAGRSPDGRWASALALGVLLLSRRRARRCSAASKLSV